MTAAAPDGTRLFTVSTRGLVPVTGTWPVAGMAASDTLDVGFTGIPDEPGEPGGYTRRPGFAHGGAGVAACWYGGARGVGQALLTAAARRDVGPHALAHLGAVDIAPAHRQGCTWRPGKRTPTPITRPPAVRRGGPGA